MNIRTTRSPSFRRGCSWILITIPVMLAACAIAFALTFSRTQPFIEQKFESLRYRIYEYLPEPPHPDAVPTPMATSVAFKPAALAATATLTPQAAATELPSALPAQTLAIAQNSPTRPAAKPPVAIKAIQPAAQLTGIAHEYQRWNNCGPTNLKMYLSFFGRRDTQLQIADAVKPDPDDKNVSPWELTAYAQQDGMNSMYRVNGTLDRIKLFLSNGLPVMVETGYDPPGLNKGWMGHYRVVTGYDEAAHKFIAQDSYEGPNQPQDYAAFDADWRAFNRTYLLVYTNAQAPLVRGIVGDDLDDTKMYNTAAMRAQSELTANPKDAFAAFNLGSSLVGLKKYDDAATAFDEARVLKLPWRMMWYQFGPYEAYYQVARYDELIALADATQKTVGDLEESYYYKGLALERLGRTEDARAAFALAVKFNKNYDDAQRALAELAQ